MALFNFAFRHLSEHLTLSSSLASCILSLRSFSTNSWWEFRSLTTHFSRLLTAFCSDSTWFLGFFSSIFDKWRTSSCSWRFSSVNSSTLTMKEVWDQKAKSLSDYLFWRKYIFLDSLLLFLRVRSSLVLASSTSNRRMVVCNITGSGGPQYSNGSGYRILRNNFYLVTSEVQIINNVTHYSSQTHTHNWTCVEYFSQQNILIEITYLINVFKNKQLTVKVYILIKFHNISDYKISPIIVICSHRLCNFSWSQQF